MGNQNIINYIKIFLKGFAMGTSDVIPGVSGGTIAFITGIYEQFIRSIKNISTKKFFMMKIKFLKGNFTDFKKDFFKLEMDFLLILLFGIFLAIIIMSKLILYLLNNFQGYTLTFFVGLIIASTLFIIREIKNHNIFNYSSGLIGLICGFLLIFIPTNNLIQAPLLYIGFGGFFAISAMFLPGISGSFILLILGLYNIVYGAIHNFLEDWKILLSFGTGAILGAIFISRLINFLFNWNKSRTLYFLLGLIIGALAIPITTILEITKFEIKNSLLLILFLIMGFSIVFIIEKISKKLENKN